MADRPGELRKQKPYRTPTLESHGPVDELTKGVSGAATDGLIGSQVISDRDLKEHFAPVDGREVLRKLAVLPISTWTYLEAGQRARHIGPVAQDFAASFGVGASDRYIGTVDAIGVAFAAIQALAAGLEERDRLIAALRADLDQLTAGRRID
jgi:hypothetical protein